MKTRGLRKSLAFLERLHTSVLRKARLTLEKYEPGDLDNSSNEEYEGDTELKRYGTWSPEARALNLPSFRYENNELLLLFLNECKILCKDRQMGIKASDFLGLHSYFSPAFH